MHVYNKMVNSKFIMMVMLYLLFFLPAYFLTLKYIKYFYYGIGIVISCFFILVELFNKKKCMEYKKIVRLLFLISSFYIVIIISTYVNKGTLVSIFAQSLISIGFSISIFYFFKKGYIEGLIKAMIFGLEFYTVINLIIVILYPEGLYTVYGYIGNYSNPAYLLGHKNNAIEYCIPLIGLVELNDINEGKRHSKNKLFVRIISILTVVQTWSVNAILCMAFIVICDIYIKFKRKSKVMDVMTFFLSTVVLSVMLIFFNIQQYFSGFLVNILQKNVTMSSRTKIWKRSIDYIINSPFIGYGIESAEVKYLKIGHPNSCHNYFLDYMYYGGTILLVIVFLMVLVLNKQINNLIDYVKMRITVMFGAYFILWIATPIHRDYIFIMFGMMVVVMCFSSVNSLKNRNLMTEHKGK